MLAVPVCIYVLSQHAGTCILLCTLRPHSPRLILSITLPSHTHIILILIIQKLYTPGHGKASPFQP